MRVIAEERQLLVKKVKFALMEKLQLKRYA